MYTAYAGKDAEMIRNRFEVIRANAMRKAREWAESGNVYMTQNFVDQACNIRPVTDRELAHLNRCLKAARTQ